jgi:hypothetical protein
LFSLKKNLIATGFPIVEDPVVPANPSAPKKDTHIVLLKRTGTIGDCLYALVKAFQGFGLEFVRPKLKF